MSDQDLIDQDRRMSTGTEWDWTSCPGCGKTDTLDVEEASGGAYELFTVMSICCGVQWTVAGLEMAAACDPIWNNDGSF